MYTILPAGALAAAFGKDPEVCKKASPQNHVREGLPPFLILYADMDLGNLGKQAEAFAPALKEKKVEATLLMETHRITSLIVVDAADVLVGALNVHDLMRAGVV